MAKNGFKAMDSDMHVFEPADSMAALHRQEISRARAQRDSIAPSVTSASRSRARSCRFRATRRIQRWRNIVKIFSRRSTAKPASVTSTACRNCRRWTRKASTWPFCFRPVVSRCLGMDGLDPDFATAIARAYNDWLHDFAETDPSRMFGVTMVAPHDISGSIEEIRRTVREYGFRGIFIRPNHVNNRKWSDPYYDPLWAECEKLNLPVGFHEAGRVYLPQPAFFHICSTFSMFNTFGFPFANMLACGDMIFGGVMERFPKLKVAFLEGNCSWVPWLLWRMGEYAETTGQAEYPYLKLTPLEYFQRQCYGAVECDEITAKHIPEYGLEDNMVFSTDYPHLDVKYPHAIDTFLQLPFSEQTKRKYLWDNCARLYNFE